MTCATLTFRWREQTRPGISGGCSSVLQTAAGRRSTRQPARTANTCANLLKIRSRPWWHFLKNPAVPPTNNAAERALRGFRDRKRKLSFLHPIGRG